MKIIPKTGKELMEKYPKIFRQKDIDMRQTCMCWGIECGKGWLELLDMLCFSLQWNTDRNGYPQVEATQVKEKFGTLRFYYTTVSVEGKEHTERQYGAIDGRIEFAELLSESICEKCGSNHNVTQTEGRITSLCENCIK